MRLLSVDPSPETPLLSQVQRLVESLLLRTVVEEELLERESLTPPSLLTLADLSRASPGRRGGANSSFHSKAYEAIGESLRREAPPVVGVGSFFSVAKCRD